MDLISVIVPVYNVEQYLIRCVESIQRQTYKNLEIILVDDGSPDNCPQICDELKLSDSRIKVIHKKNSGLGFARNSGLEVATGKYVTFIDSDDWISESHIENLYNAVVDNDADAAIGGHTAIDALGRTVEHPSTLENNIYEDAEILDRILLPLIGPDVDFPNDLQVNSSCCMNLYCINIIKDNGIKFLSEKYAVAEDLYFNVDFFYNSHRVCCTNENGYFYFENTDSISRKYDPERFGRTVNYYSEIMFRMKKYHLLEKISLRVERTYLLKLRIAIKLIVISDLPLKDKFNQIRITLEHPVSRSVLNCYPIEKFIPSMRLLAYMMRNRNVLGIYMLMKFRLFAKQSKLLSEVLKLIGIGK